MTASARRAWTALVTAAVAFDEVVLDLAIGDVVEVSARPLIEASTSPVSEATLLLMLLPRLIGDDASLRGVQLGASSVWQ